MIRYNDTLQWDNTMILHNDTLQWNDTTTGYNGTIQPVTTIRYKNTKGTTVQQCSDRDTRYALL
ncbi:MAG: hypothetical protein AAF518_17680 [Spirochaetota bacterium]